jgi:hypothetical protein
VKGDRSTAGVDIVQEKREARAEQKAIEIKAVMPTFEECAETYIRGHWSSWSENHRNQWPSSLKRYAYPTIGKLKIADIRPSHIHDLLEPIWVEKRETANRVRGRIETVIAKNADVDDTDFRNPAELRLALIVVEDAEAVARVRGGHPASDCRKNFHRLRFSGQRRCVLQGGGVGINANRSALDARHRARMPRQA